MQFGADQSSEVQWAYCLVWYFLVQSSVVQCSAVWWSQAQAKTVQSSEEQCRPVQSSEVLSGQVQSSPLRWRAVQSTECSLSLRKSNFVRSRPIPFIPFQLSTFQSSRAQVHITQQQSILVQSIAVQSSAIRNSSVPSRPLQSFESRKTQSCSVKLRTTNCIAARQVKWSAIRKSPHLSPFKCNSVQCCLQLSHQHNEARLLALS